MLREPLPDPMAEPERPLRVPERPPLDRDSEGDRGSLLDADPVFDAAFEDPEMEGAYANRALSSRSRIFDDDPPLPGLSDEPEKPVLSKEPGGTKEVFEPIVSKGPERFASAKVPASRG